MYEGNPSMVSQPVRNFWYICCFSSLLKDCEDSDIDARDLDEVMSGLARMVSYVGAVKEAFH